MLIRYRRSENGQPEAKALVYTQAEHRIDKSRIDVDALRIIERLRESGHAAYLVGGAVRDLLLGRRPKDFDIVTDAQPPRIKRVFRSARVIGRRFRLVHVYAGPKIFEVSTFRSIANGTVGNEYGTMDEDALRRDFTCNALYYDPIEDQLVDYVGGFKDIEARRIVPVIPLKCIFKEDSVRMIRCVKYAATSDFRIPFLTRRAIRRDATLLAEASPSRLTEEFQKILASGRSELIVKGLAEFDLLRHIQPKAAELFSRDGSFRTGLMAGLAELDALAVDPNKEKRLALLIAQYLRPFFDASPGMIVDTPEAYQNAVHQARLFLSPLNPPRVELEAAVLVIFKKRGISPLQKPRRPGPERGREERGREERGRPGEKRNAERRQGLPGEAIRQATPGKRASETENSSVSTHKRRRRPGKGSAQAPKSTGAEQSPHPSSETPPSTTSGAARRRRRRRRPPTEGGEA